MRGSSFIGVDSGGKFKPRKTNDSHPSSVSEVLWTLLSSSWKTTFFSSSFSDYMTSHAGQLYCGILTRFSVWNCCTFLSYMTKSVCKTFSDVCRMTMLICVSYSGLTSFHYIKVKFKEYMECSKIFHVSTSRHTLVHTYHNFKWAL